MIKYECVRCANQYADPEVDCPKCGCGVATSVHPDEAGATIELPSQPVQDLSARLQKAMWAGVSVRISSDPLGPQLSALIVEMAGYEAEAYALQDQVDEANSSVTALEQQILELTAQNEKLRQDFTHTVDYMNEGCICGRAPAPKHPVDPRLLSK